MAYYRVIKLQIHLSTFRHFNFMLLFSSAAHREEMSLSKISSFAGK